MSQGRRGELKTDERAYRDHWDFFEQCAYFRGYPAALPKILVSHGLGSLFAAHLCAQRPGFFKASISVSPWLSMADKPNQFSMGINRAKCLTSIGFEPYWNENEYLPQNVVD